MTVIVLMIMLMLMLVVVSMTMRVAVIMTMSMSMIVAMIKTSMESLRHHKVGNQGKTGSIKHELAINFNGIEVHDSQSSKVDQEGGQDPNEHNTSQSTDDTSTMIAKGV